MERSEHYNFYLPSSSTDDIADIDQLSENFEQIDTELASNYELINEVSDQAEQYAAIAEEAMERTELAERALETGTTVIFNGGTASAAFTVDITVDDEISASSTNPVQNKKIVQKIGEVEDGLNDDITALGNRLTAVEGFTLASLKAAVFDSVYPVGSIYLSTVSTSPATLFGGTWVQIQDRFLLAAGSTYSANSTGGEANHQLKLYEMDGGVAATMKNTSGSTVTVDGTVISGTSVSSGDFAIMNLKEYYEIISNTHLDSNQKYVQESIDTMPPYLAVYMWKRTA